LNLGQKLKDYSLFIHGADTYLHLTTKAVEALQIKTEDPSGHLYSRGLASWCTTRPTLGSVGNPNFWGCGLSVDSKTIGPSNLTSVTALEVGVSEYHDILDFVDKDGLHLAVLVPKGITPGIDWRAISFAVSTQCQPLRNSSCEFSTEPDISSQWKYLFNCSSTEPELEVSGVMYSVQQQRRYYNWHRYFEEAPLFINQVISNQALDYLARSAQKLTDNEAGQVFSNPWQMLSVLQRPELESADNIKSDNDQLIFSQPSAIFAYCNITGSYEPQIKYILR
jgi:hypothetical protein